MTRLRAFLIACILCTGLAASAAPDAIFINLTALSW